MTDRFTAYLSMLAGRDAALLALALLSLAGLAAWVGVRWLKVEVQDKVLAFAALCYYLTLIAVIGGSS